MVGDELRRTPRCGSVLTHPEGFVETWLEFCGETDAAGLGVWVSRTPANARTRMFGQAR
jgi:hypothetical protein